MKKTFSVVVVLFVLLMLPVVSFSAAPKPYISGNFGLAFLTDSDISGGGDMEFDNPGFTTNFAGGVNFGMFRVEGEIGYQGNEIDNVSGYGASGDVYCTTLLVNGYVDFINNSPITPYISGGIGIANIDVDDFRVGSEWIGGDDDTVFALQVGFGLAYAINKNMSLDLKYRYLVTQDPEFGGIDGEFASHNISFGFRYTF